MPTRLTNVSARATERGALAAVRERWDILACISLGGAAGSVARYAVGEAIPHADGAFAWSTFIENVSGALLLGVLMALVLDVWPRSRYVRPLVGVGLLGGYTTFSTYMLDAHDLARTGQLPLALSYLLSTLVCGLFAAWLGVVLGRVGVRGLRRTASRTSGTSRTRKTSRRRP
jgi:CrcB protein